MVSAVAHYPLSRVLRGLDEYFPLLTPLTFLWPSHRRCLAKNEGEHGFLSVLSFCFMPGNFAAVICRAYQCAASGVTVVIRGKWAAPVGRHDLMPPF